MSDKEQKKEETSAVNEKNGELLRWVTFKLGNEIYGVNVMQVREVLRYTDIAPVPGAPSYVLGIINLRGNVVTVIDTRARFGIPPAEVTDNTRIMIIESEKHVIGILVDSVAEVATTPPACYGDENYNAPEEKEEVKTKGRIPI